MTPREFLNNKGIFKVTQFIYSDTNNKVHTLDNLLQEYAQLETEELNKLLDKQIDTFLTPEKQQELIDYITNESNFKTKE